MGAGAAVFGLEGRALILGTFSMGAKPVRSWQAFMKLDALLESSDVRNMPEYVALPPPASSRARQNTCAPLPDPRVANTFSSNLSCQKAVSKVTTFTARCFSNKGLKTFNAASRCGPFLWPRTTQVLRVVHSDGHFLSVSILCVSTFKAGLMRFSSSSIFPIPTRLIVRGLLPFATTNDKGGFKFILNLCATLRPLAVLSQH
mmetsp:Transcript_48251/g.140667  ORF Transcript_48251/g.140667 Transcript_48251/m.140667 type:complete len:202 (-) Transcript_48251:557-1162(-)